MELFYVVLGIFMLYAMGHFLVIQHNYNWAERTIYERFVSVSGIVFFLIMVLSVMSK